MSLEVLIFLLGQLSAVALQLLVSRLALRREQRKEAWIRRLNSYENFYRASTQLIDLFQANVEVPQSSAWESIADARKAAYDASSYDPGNPGRTARMREVSLDLVVHPANALTHAVSTLPVWVQLNGLAVWLWVSM